MTHQRYFHITKFVDSNFNGNSFSLSLLSWNVTQWMTFHPETLPDFHEELFCQRRFEISGFLRTYIVIVSNIDWSPFLYPERRQDDSSFVAVRWEKIHQLCITFIAMWLHLMINVSRLLWKFNRDGKFCHISHCYGDDV